nr:hypothetical protein HK105_006403 [Polyrhizophydium stewartii]
MVVSPALSKEELVDDDKNVEEDKGKAQQAFLVQHGHGVDEQQRGQQQVVKAHDVASRQAKSSLGELLLRRAELVLSDQDRDRFKTNAKALAVVLLLAGLAAMSLLLVLVVLVLNILTIAFKFPFILRGSPMRKDLPMINDRAGLSRFLDDSERRLDQISASSATGRDSLSASLATAASAAPTITRFQPAVKPAANLVAKEVIEDGLVVRDPAKTLREWKAEPFIDEWAESTRKNATARSRVALERYLAVGKYTCREYILDRIKSLLLDFYPLDLFLTFPQLVMHLFCRYLDELTNTLEPHKISGFSDKHFLPVGAKPVAVAAVMIREQSRWPAHYQLVVDNTIWDVYPSRNNLFHVLSLFVYAIKCLSSGFIGSTRLLDIVATGPLISRFETPRKRHGQPTTGAAPAGGAAGSDSAQPIPSVVFTPVTARR